MKSGLDTLIQKLDSEWFEGGFLYKLRERQFDPAGYVRFENLLNNAKQLDDSEASKISRDSVNVMSRARNLFGRSKSEISKDGARVTCVSRNRLSMKSLLTIMRLVALAIISSVLVFTARAEPPSLEAYSSLPTIHSISISPDGTRLALIRSEGASQALIVLDQTLSPIAQVNVENLRPRDAYFASNDAIILLVSERQNVSTYQTSHGSRILGDFEYSTAFGFVISENKATQLLSRNKLFLAQSGLGKVVGISADGQHALMPAFSDIRPPRYDLYRTQLSSVRGSRYRAGTEDTIDWFVDSEGAPIIREDYDSRRGVYEVFSYIDGKPKRIHHVKGLGRPTSGVVGLTPNGGSLIYNRGKDEEGAAGFFLMSLSDGSIGEEVFADETADITRILQTQNRVILGVEFAGMTPTFEFLDEHLNSRIQTLIRNLPNKDIAFVSWTADLTAFIVRLSGSDAAGDYFLFDTSSMSLSFLGTGRPNIPTEAIAPVEVFEYDARDGLPIEAVLTGAPAEGAEPKPLILLPHGGPASQDTIGFDWMAQYFASRGYAVLQPNFRGSTGYGRRFLEAGHGEWGGKMQDDLSDGVLALAETGRIDADRVCIIGASYGGYAALMGGATTPDLFKCVVAIAPVTDLKRMLREELTAGGHDSPSLDYWKEQLGVERIGDRALNAVAPVRLAASFDDPVLLLHGEDDTVVPIKHSIEMERALKRAGKSVKFVKLKGEDHWLSRAETRTQLLREINDFLEAHLPSRQNTYYLRNNDNDKG